MCDHTLIFFFTFYYHRKIYFHLKVSEVILYNMLYQKNVKVSVKAILTSRISKYWKLKNSSKRLYMRPNAFNRQFLIIPVKNYQKFMLLNQYIPQKSNFKVDILETMKQMHFFENSSFLGTTCHIKCPHSLSNENLFSCDNKMWENFSV